jgi:acyl carrier protein
MPSRHQVFHRVAVLLREITGTPLELATEHATLDDQLQLQSVAFIELQIAIEEEYTIRIDPVHMVELNRLGAIVDYIHRCTISAVSE